MKNERMTIPGHPGYYADRTGRIWSNRHGRWHIVRSIVNGTGYQYTYLKEKNSPRKSHLTQRLVCAAFKNEHTNDLPICIRQAPGQQPRRLRKQKYLHWGNRDEVKRKYTPHLTNYEKHQIIDLCTYGYSQVEIAQRYGVSQPAVSYIVRGKTRVQ